MIESAVLLTDVVREAAHPLVGAAEDYDPLMKMIGDRASHYFDARLSDQFDAVLHFDETRAVEPLERSVEWETGEVAETFPSGI